MSPDALDAAAHLVHVRLRDATREDGVLLILSSGVVFVDPLASVEELVGLFRVSMPLVGATVVHMDSQGNEYVVAKFDYDGAS